MRVGRIIPIKMMSHRDVTTLMKMFAKKGIATASRQELSKVDEITSIKDQDMKSQINARNSLNDIVIDSTKESLLKSAERKTGILAERQKIDIIKNMEKAKQGVKISSLDFLAKSQVNKNLINKAENDENNNSKPTNYDENIQKNQEPKKTQEIKEQKSILTEYDELLKKLSDKKDKEKISEKDYTEKKEDKSIKKEIS